MSRTILSARARERQDPPTEIVADVGDELPAIIPPLIEIYAERYERSPDGLSKLPHVWDQHSRGDNAEPKQQLGEAREFSH